MKRIKHRFLVRDGNGKLKGKRTKREALRQQEWRHMEFKENLRLMYECQPWAVGG